MNNDDDSERKKWLDKIDDAFGTRPRDGSIQGSVWLKREKYENTLFDTLATRTPHLCVDGPTGTGKTSLVLTQLHRIRREYVYIPIGHQMKWADFCRELVRKPEERRSAKADSHFEFSWDGLTPHFSYRRSLVPDKVKSVDELKKEAEGWRPHDVAALIGKDTLVLVIDDFEKAKGNTDFINNISDLCKLLSSQFDGKIAIIGTGSVFYDLMDTDPALEGRVREISVGTVEKPLQSWEILLQGFTKLGFQSPAQLARSNPQNETYKRELQECVFHTYLAADGLLKHINELGAQICKHALGRITRGPVRTIISVADILSVTRKLQIDNFNFYRRYFPQIRDMVEKHVEVRQLFQAIYEIGANNIHTVSDFVEHFDGKMDEEHIRFALDRLVELDLFSRTGRSGDVVFSNNPTLIHTLGVVCARPEDYGDSARKYGMFGQLSLPLLPNR